MIKESVMSICVAILVCALLLPQTGVAEDTPEQEEARSWTVALYVCGDNNLETYWEGMSLAMMLNLPASSGVSFVAYVDLFSTTGTQIVEVDDGECLTVEELPEKNFGDGKTLEWFLTDVRERYPSDHLAVIAWDHGSAWKGFCTDDTSDGDRIIPSEMSEAISDAGVSIDILAFDACAAGSMEMAYEASTTGLVDLMVASEELVAGNGYPYDRMFTPVAEDPDRTPLQVAEDMLEGWETYYLEIGWSWYATLGILDIGQVAAHFDAINAWTECMLAGLDEHLDDYRYAVKHSSTVSCVSHYQVDMLDLGRHLLDVLKPGTDRALSESVEGMMEAVEDIVVDVYNPTRKTMCGGISLFWGFNNEEWRYYGDTYTSTIGFACDTSWGEFLVEFNELSSGWYTAA